MNKLVTYIFYFLFLANASLYATYDVTVIGLVNHADGLARISVGVIDLFKEDLKINCIPTSENKLKDISKSVQKILLNKSTTPGNVSFFCSPPGTPL